MSYRRITGTPPIIDIDGALWSVFAKNEGTDAEIAIQVCEGFHVETGGHTVQTHEYDGEWHDGDLHLFLENDAASRLLGQLREAFDDRNAEHYVRSKS